MSLDNVKHLDCMGVVIKSSNNGGKCSLLFKALEARNKEIIKQKKQSPMGFIEFNRHCDSFKLEKIINRKVRSNP